MNTIATSFITSQNLPLVIEPIDKNMPFEQFLELLRTENDFFKKNLLKYGALLFRNFPVRNAQDFTKVIQNLGTGAFIDYIGGDSPRNEVEQGVYTSTEAPPWFKIPLHNELSYAKNFPSHIHFFCEIAPIKDGETFIADARKIYRSIDESVRQRFIDKKLRYYSRYYAKSPMLDLLNKFQKGNKPWRDVFGTDKKDEVERLCRDNDISFKWNQNDWLEISQTRPAAISHPETHEMVWFNQAHHYDFNPRLLGFWKYLGSKLLYFRKHTLLHEVFFGDHSLIPRSDLYHIMDVLDENSVYFPWKKGDVLALDNILAMHGRAPFRGKRRILTAMTGK